MANQGSSQKTENLSQDVTKSDVDRGLYNAEFTKLGAYIDDLATKEFNGVPLFDGTGLDVTTDNDGNTVTTTGVDLAAGAYTTATGSTVDTAANAATALTNSRRPSISSRQTAPTWVPTSRC